MIVFSRYNVISSFFKFLNFEWVRSCITHSMWRWFTGIWQLKYQSCEWRLLNRPRNSSLNISTNLALAGHSLKWQSILASRLCIVHWIYQFSTFSKSSLHECNWKYKDLSHSSMPSFWQLSSLWHPKVFIDRTQNGRSQIATMHHKEKNGNYSVLKPMMNSITNLINIDCNLPRHTS